MACCAFVAFLISQLYVMSQALKRRMRGKRESPMPPEAMWRLAPPASAGASRQRAVRPRGRPPVLVSLAIVAELAVLIGGAAWLDGAGAQSLVSEVQRLTRVESLADLAIICTTKR